MEQPPQLRASTNKPPTNSALADIEMQRYVRLRQILPVGEKHCSTFRCREMIESLPDIDTSLERCFRDYRCHDLFTATATALGTLQHPCLGYNSPIQIGTLVVDIPPSVGPHGSHQRIRDHILRIGRPNKGSSEPRQLNTVPLKYFSLGQHRHTYMMPPNPPSRTRIFNNLQNPQTT
jgi:hypothetical protein